MDAKEIFVKISEVLEKFGIKEALKNPNVVETIYDVMTKHGMKVDKMMFNLVVMGIATTPADKLGDIFSLITSMLAGGASAAAQGQGGAAANPLAAILGAVAQGQAGTQQPAQGQQKPSADAANPLAALGALGAIAGALGGAAQQGQAGQQQSQNQAAGPNAADLLGALANAMTKK